MTTAAQPPRTAPERITLFEHDYKPIPNWTDDDQRAIGRLNDRLGVDVLRVTAHGGKKLKAFQYVGVIRLGNRVIQILPKIHCPADDATKIEDAAANLMHMLAYAFDLPRQYGLAPLLARKLDWFDLLTRLFADDLLKQLHRGPYRTYHAFDDDLPVLKGKWRIGDQFHRPECHHIFAVTVDEFTADNPLNRVFLYVCRRLLRQTADPKNRQLLTAITHALEDVTALPHCTAMDAAPALINNLNRRYQPHLNLARLFLGGNSLQLSGGKMETFAFLFDMNKLFEAFVANFIKKYRAEILPSSLADCAPHPQSNGHSRAFAHDGFRDRFHLYPDLAFRQPDGTFPLLLDTKYKILNPADSNLGIAESDIYQIAAYAHCYQCPRVILLYPQPITGPLRRTYTLHHDKTIQLTAATIDLHLNLATEIQTLKQSLRQTLEAATIP